MHAISESGKENILKEFLSGEDPNELTDATPLITGGILDSLATLKLVAFLEERFSITLKAHEADVDHFNTISAITALVLSKKWTRRALSRLAQGPRRRRSARARSTCGRGGRRPGERHQLRGSCRPFQPPAGPDATDGGRPWRPGGHLRAEVHRHRSDDLRDPRGRGCLRPRRSVRSG